MSVGGSAVGVLGDVGFSVWVGPAVNGVEHAGKANMMVLKMIIAIPNPTPNG
jgi:hypothetical protein